MARSRVAVMIFHVARLGEGVSRETYTVDESADGGRTVYVSRETSGCGWWLDVRDDAHRLVLWVSDEEQARRMAYTLALAASPPFPSS